MDQPDDRDEPNDADVDAARARAYLLLAALLARPPSTELLGAVAALRGDAATPWGRALEGLAAAAGGLTPRDAEREFNRLFVGVSRGELMPYASFYRTGFLHDRPLIDLRLDMTRLGIARSPEVKEPEDHIAAVLEMMGGLIQGRFGAAAPTRAQRAFFERHLLPWAPGFFRDLEAARSARFYRTVGALGILLLEIEQSGFTLVE